MRFATLWICLLPALLVTPCAGAENNWQYLETSEGVHLYRSLQATEGFIPFKATALLDVPHEKIVMALVDAENKNRWAPKLKSATVHAEKSTNCFEYSEYYTTPWPFKDREFLLVGSIAYLRDQVLFSAVNSPNRHLADNGHQLVDIAQLAFAIIPVEPEKTRVEFTFSGDLGGWIPPFVRDIIQEKWPVRFIQALKKSIEKNQIRETARYQALRKAPLTLEATSRETTPRNSKDT